MDDDSNLVDSSGAHHSKTRRVVAAAVSSVVPGIGQVLLGKTRAGIGFLCALGFLLLLYWPLRLPRSSFGMLVIMFLTAGLFILAGWHTLRTPSQHTGPGSRWWLLLLVPLALKASFWNDTLWLLLIGLHAFYVPSTSMEPTVIVGDYAITDFAYYRESRPKRNDLVVIQRGGLSLMKRVVATVGDTVEGKDDLVFLNGQLLKEPYVEHIGDALHLNQFGPLNVMPGELFVLGDNRDQSRDSRSAEFGPVTESSVLGKVLYVVRRPKWWRTGQNRIADALRALHRALHHESPSPS